MPMAFEHYGVLVGTLSHHFRDQPVGELSPGYHELLREQCAGALDHIRHPAIVECPWVSGSYAEASTALESILVAGSKTMVWGEPFTTGLGMHNIHQNQGDPAGSQWWEENGIWQDGATMVERVDGAYDAFVSKFSTQASETDEDGHPA